MNKSKETRVGGPGADRTGVRLPVGVVTAWLASELAALAADLEQFQNDLSDLLSEAHVSTDFMQRLQSLDSATQALVALAHVAVALENVAQTDADGVAAEELTDLVKLGDLRQRLLGSEPAAPTDPEESMGGHVNLF